MSSTQAFSTTSNTPRIYAACLAAYNAGCLHGEWIDACRSAEEIYEDVQRMLAASPVSGAEEWTIHDYDGFGALRLSEWESVERVSAIAQGITEHGPAFSAWLSYDEDRDLNDQAFEDTYRGEWVSMHDYAENYAEDVGMYDAAEKTGFSYVTVDLDMLTRDLDIELYSVESDHHTVYIFDPNG